MPCNYWSFPLHKVVAEARVGRYRTVEPLGCFYLYHASEYVSSFIVGSGSAFTRLWNRANLEL